ncbi:unnamed protein product [Rotaria socialis]|uniref:Uncharacterized protein n=1 Tax=Rotaria socialis TaxID=392032 RepID=A0A818EMB0_9BILA|nr:unnamed protein product [Rotaria socialis]CAF3460973.1 unnamed protein product [Rotaria socialis]CAF3778878.1 unnamed protein product [Rotaria socialis]
MQTHLPSINYYYNNKSSGMLCFQMLLSVIILVQSIVVKSYTWNPDPQRAATLQARWNKFNSLPYITEAAVEQVCGALGDPKCWKPAGRPSDEETESCDRWCCHRGFITGSCQGGVSIGISGNNYGSVRGEMHYKPTFNGFSNCICTNDLTDVRCGIDGSFLGIRCPADWSACRRKCCRQGRSGGHCGGFLRLKCKCD